MSNWISSKLKAAETILQQIDQQAAESLKKNDATSSPTNHTAIHGGDQIHSKKLDPSPSLKFQLPSKKATPLYRRRSPLPPTSPLPNPALRHPTPPLDWTELLSSPDPKVSIKKKVIKKPVVVAIKEEVIEESAVEKEEEEEEEEGKGDEGSGSSSSGSGSDLEYDSEEEGKRREEMIAEKAKEAAVKAIKEREDAVARLEGEKEGLEKILEERAKQQAQEAMASAFRTTSTIGPLAAPGSFATNKMLSASSQKLSQLSSFASLSCRSVNGGRQNLHLQKDANPRSLQWLKICTLTRMGQLLRSYKLELTSLQTSLGLLLGQREEMLFWKANMGLKKSLMMELQWPKRLKTVKLLMWLQLVLKQL